MNTREYKKIINQLGRTIKLKSLNPIDKKTLYKVRLKYYNKIKDVKAMDFYELVDIVADELNETYESLEYPSYTILEQPSKALLKNGREDDARERLKHDILEYNNITQ